MAMSAPGKRMTASKKWNFMMKSLDWLDKMVQLQQGGHPLLRPMLVGSDLNQIVGRKIRPARLMKRNPAELSRTERRRRMFRFTRSHRVRSKHLVLLVDGWKGEVDSNKMLFFKSLRKHDYDKRTGLLKLRQPAVKVYVQDYAGDHGQVEVGNLGALFWKNGKHLHAHALMHGDRRIHRVEARLLHAGGRRVPNLHRLQMMFSDGKVISRSVQDAICASDGPYSHWSSDSE
jgi:hypothetical protein